MAQLLRRLRIRLKPHIHFLLRFDNIAGLRGNLLYAIYHWLCRYQFRRLNRARPAASAGTSAFRREARVVLLPDESVLAGLDLLPARLMARLDDPSSRTRFEFLNRHFFDQSDFETARHMLSARVDDLLKEVLGSYYAVTSAYLYRTTPSKETPRSTFLWHVDDHPDCHLKLFFYLTDTVRRNGALQAHSWASSRELKRRGFTDRRNIPPTLVADLNDERRYSVVEGARGTAILFSANTIHRAVIPEERHRDVLGFEFVPSPNSSVRYLQRHFEFWEHPLDLLFPRADAPRSVGVYD